MSPSTPTTPRGAGAAAAVDRGRPRPAAAESPSVLDGIRPRTWEEREAPAEWGYDVLLWRPTGELIYRVFDGAGVSWSTHSTEEAARTAVWVMRSLGRRTIDEIPPWTRERAEATSEARRAAMRAEAER